MKELLIAIITSFLGGLIGVYCGSRFSILQEERKVNKVRNIAIKALMIIRKYSGQSYKNVENEFNTSMSIIEKRTVIVALHKLGIPIVFPSNEAFNINHIQFNDIVIDNTIIDMVINQIERGYCDKLFYIDPDTYFASNLTLYAMRNAGKKYVEKVLYKSKVDIKTNILCEPVNLGNLFSLGEFKAIQVFREQVRDQMYFDKNGQPINEKLDSLIKDIELGLWDSYLMWNYEVYKNTQLQIQMGLKMMYNTFPQGNSMANGDFINQNKL